jgi:hypothetical protein
MTTVQHSVSFTKDPSGAPAVDLKKVHEAGHVDLAKAAEKAGFALSKRDLAGMRAQVLVVLDESGSMRHDYESGAVQKLLQRCLGFALQVDADGTVPVIPFADNVWKTVEVTQANFATVVQEKLYRPGDMGLTNLTEALERVKDAAAQTDMPLFVIILTDGSPNHKPSATQLVCELAGYPAFLKFVALRPVDYLSELDDLPNSRRLLDNVDSKPEVGTNLDLLNCSDAEFADALADEWDTWVKAATAAGVLKA